MTKRVVQVNVITYALSAAGLIVVVSLSWFIPDATGAFTQPFSCNDQSIRYPKKLERISTTPMMIVTFLLGILSVGGVEVLMHFKAKSDIRFKFRKWYLLPLLVHIMAHIGYFVTGYILQIFMLQVAKYSIGRLRPHFYSVCWPKEKGIHSCTTGEELVYDYKCNGDPSHIAEARLSFYSGHASICFYTTVFLSLYLQARVGARMPRVLLAFTQTFLLSCALYVAFTRIEDFYHHPSDILTGSIVGLLGGIYTCYFWADFFPKNQAYNPTHVRQLQEELDSNLENHVETKKSDKNSSKQDKMSSTNQPSSSDNPVPEIPAAPEAKTPGGNSTVVAQTEYANTPSVTTAMDTATPEVKTKVPPPSSS
ncbi:hypothetical protein PFISCL1PPCAC_6577 [Pristionchus fissidentatus]|uniref:Phosphatidic acid phosphatase type 2/haloperoxidase domain-containing protein n=1 Tax=Pristionchus fissidentatus TaxID=1538716 RepID=A0AAV5V9P1_9BILA|nr:hypothetical protein PFISCL1PPCAC_6577 [Pristionchus fissidentatus]